MTVNITRQKRASAVSGGLFLISLGILGFTGWWWPGIMLAIGLSAGAGLVFRGKILHGLGTLAFFCAIPIGIWAIQNNDIPWSLVGPLALIGLGVIVLAKSFYLQPDNP